MVWALAIAKIVLCSLVGGGIGYLIACWSEERMHEKLEKEMKADGGVYYR
jgi:membrane protein YqaA with SNARE-associated domain